MIYKGENKAQIVKGDFHPAELYKGDKRIAGFISDSFESNDTVALENCYNDKLYNARLSGNCVQEGTPSHDNPVEVKSVGTPVTEGEFSGKYKIGVTARGKNLFKFLKSSVQQATTIETLENGAIVRGNINEAALEGSWSRGWYTPGYADNSAILPVFNIGETVTVSASITLLEARYGSSYRPIIHLCDEAGTAAKQKGNVSTSYIKEGTSLRIKETFVIDERNILGKYRPVFTLDSNTVKIENIQIEYGETDTEYEDYIEPQTFNIYLNEPLRKVPDAEDYIDFENGVVVRNLNVRNLVGTEVWYRTNSRVYTFLGSASSEVNTDNILCMSNRFEPYTWSVLWGNGTRNPKIIGIALHTKNIVSITPAQEIPSVEEWEAQLKTWNDEGTPLTLIYADVRREEALELPALPTFKGTTIYEIDTEVSAKISGEYKRTEV